MEAVTVFGIRLDSGQTFYSSGVLFGNWIISMKSLIGLKSYGHLNSGGGEINRNFTSEPLKICIVRENRDNVPSIENPNYPNGLLMCDANPIYWWRSNILRKYFEMLFRGCKGIDTKLYIDFVLLEIHPAERWFSPYIGDILYFIRDNITKNVPEPCDKILIEATPLDISHFNSLTMGIVSKKAFGGAIFRTDCLLFPGSEGAPVYWHAYLPRKLCCGIVVYCNIITNRSTFPICASMSHILFEAQIQFGFPLNPRLQLVSSDEVTGLGEKWLVQIRNGCKVGTGVLLFRNIVVTCGHVINNPEESLEREGNLEVYFRGSFVHSTVLFHTNNDNYIDISVLEIETHPRMKPITIANFDMKEGETVFTYGFPLDGIRPPHFPSIASGIISHYKNRLRPLYTTCYLMPGFSGGPVVRSNKELVAIAMSTMDTVVDDIIVPPYSSNISIDLFVPAVMKFLCDYGDSGFRLPRDFREFWSN